MIFRPGRARFPFQRIPVPFQRIPVTNGPERPPELSHTFKRTPKDCAEVRKVLSKTANFQPEIIDIVMDFAEYWACSVTSVDYSGTAIGNTTIHGGGEREDKLLLRTEPVGLTAWHSDDQDRWQAAAPTRKLAEDYPQEELDGFVDGPPSLLEHPARKIIFDIVSRDQGWSHDLDSHHTFRHSWTWFEAGIDRFDKGHKDSNDGVESDSGVSGTSAKGPTTDDIRPVWPPLKESLTEYDHALHPVPDHMIQSNRVAEDDWQHHHVEWSWTDRAEPQPRVSEELEADGRGSATGDGSFLRTLKVGDMVTVWGHARFPQWKNIVQRVQVQVYWAL